MPKTDLFDKAILRLLSKIKIPLTTRQIGLRTRMHPMTAKKHLTRLLRQKKVKKIKTGKTNRFFK